MKNNISLIALAMLFIFSNNLFAYGEEDHDKKIRILQQQFRIVLLLLNLLIHANIMKWIST